MAGASGHNEHDHNAAMEASVEAVKPEHHVIVCAVMAGVYQTIAQWRVHGDIQAVACEGGKPELAASLVKRLAQQLQRGLPATAAKAEDGA